MQGGRAGLLGWRREGDVKQSVPAASGEGVLAERAGGEGRPGAIRGRVFSAEEASAEAMRRSHRSLAHCGGEQAGRQAGGEVRQVKAPEPVRPCSPFRGLRCFSERHMREPLDNSASHVLKGPLWLLCCKT